MRDDGEDGIHPAEEEDVEDEGVGVVALDPCTCVVGWAVQPIEDSEACYVLVVVEVRPVDLKSWWRMGVMWLFLNACCSLQKTKR